MADAAERERMVNKDISRAKKTIPASELVSAFPSLVLINIAVSSSKQVALQIQFPEAYPSEPLLIELKSKVFAEDLLDKLTQLCVNEAKAFVGMCQIVPVYNKLKSWMEDNILLAAWSELVQLRSDSGDAHPELVKKVKLYEADGKVKLSLRQGNYSLVAEFVIDNNYPESEVQVSVTRSNFSPEYEALFAGRVGEIVRTARQGPLKRISSSSSSAKGSTFKERGGRKILGKSRALLNKLEAEAAAAEAPLSAQPQEWTPKPCLADAGAYLISSVSNYPTQPCQCCGARVFPDDPAALAKISSKALRVERVYCGHFFHHGCLDTYMTSPPFPDSGKLCPGCGKRIYHRKWSTSMKALESGWTHRQARDREIGEVIEFMGDGTTTAPSVFADLPPWIPHANERAVAAAAGSPIPLTVTTALADANPTAGPSASASSASSAAASANTNAKANAKAKKKKKKKAKSRLEDDDMSAFM